MTGHSNTTCADINWRQGKRRNAGFTLAEVAIALAIFVFGALAIIRIFPPALDAIRNSENLTTATLLAQGTTERLRREANLIPFDIHDADASYSGSFTGSASRNSALPKGVLESEFDASALGHFKLIRGEKQVVRLNSTTNEFFVLTQFPYSSIEGVYVETPVDGVEISANGNLSKDGVQLADGLYYVSYRWKSGGQFAGGVTDEPVVVTATSAQVLRGGAGNIDDGPVTIWQRQALPTVAPDPHQMLGYVTLTGVSVGETVSLDYTVADWRWLVDDRIPAAIPGEQEKDITQQDPEFQDQQHASLYATPRSTLLPVRDFDKDTVPQPLYTMLTTTGSTSTVEYPAPGAGFVANSKRGRIIFELGAVAPTNPVPTAKSARSVYRAVDGWTHQLSVAARSYLPFVPGRTTAMNTASPPEPWREYSWDAAVDPDYIYFHPNEAGKTVLVTYQYGSPVQTQDNLVTINEALISTPSTVFAGFDSSSKREVARVAPFVDAAGNAVTATAILAIRGVGVQARTAWINRDHYSQSVVADYRPVD